MPTVIVESLPVSLLLSMKYSRTAKYMRISCLVSQTFLSNAPGLEIDYQHYV